LIGFYLQGYLIPEKDYRWILYLRYPNLLKENIALIINTTGSALIIFSIMSNKWVYKRINGKLAYFLGKLSLSFYLLHVLFICSFGSYFFHTLHDHSLSKVMIFILTFIATLLFTVFISMFFAFLDGLWLKKINIITRKFNENF
jgi:peptidoglycan/LPS O-acetylase OafA/YrhL